jgi:tetratricopeptide (TPR) repeat protein
MPRLHRNLFHTVTRARFESAVKKLDESIPRLARHQIIVEMARIVASVGDGHTNIAPTRDPKIGFRAYPVRLYLFKDGLYVRAAARECASLVGARVVRIGNAPWERAYDAVREIIGRDNEMDVKFFAPFLLAMPEVLHALGLVDNMESAPFVVESRGQRKVAVLKPAGPAEMMPHDTDTSWLPRKDWVDARDGAQRPGPLWLKDPTNKFWLEYLPGARAVYVQFNQVGNKEEETVEAFAERLVALVESEPVERLVLDLRLNRGGNGAFNRPLLRGIIQSRKVDRTGRLFAIVGRGTWSAAQMLVNGLERYTNVLFVGEPTGGRPNAYGDSRRITLPNSGITVRVSTLWWQQDERDLRPWTAPQIAADLTFEDYRSNRDPALEAALSYVPGKPLADLLKEAVLAGDFRFASERYGQWRADPVHAYTSAEVEVNGLGYALLAAGRLDAALEIFRLNASAYPQSANVHDSLGEAYLARGDRDNAIRSYEKALSLDPNLPSAAQALEKLRAR